MAIQTPAASWAGYWRTAGPDGCTDGLPSALRDALAARWRALFAGIGPGASVLDIGCGRGAVLAHARAAGLNRLHGLDAAAIAETPFPLHVGDAAALPFPGRSFTVVTSQFGAEYAGLPAAVAEAARVAATHVWLLVHAADGPLRADAAEQAAQIAWLNASQAAFTRLAAHFTAPTPASRADIDTLRAAIVDRAETAGNISLLEGVWRAIPPLQDTPDPRAATAALAAELAAHAARMQAMVAAAPTAAAVAAAADQLRAAGFDVTVQPLVSPATATPVGRWLCATRRP